MADLKDRIDGLIKICSTRDLIPSNEIVDELLDIRNTIPIQEGQHERPEPESV